MLQKTYGATVYANYLVQKTTIEVAHMDAYKEISIQQTSYMVLHAYVGENTLHCP
jgi:ABC-type ATPase with predicted acetyltransferase domain